MKNTLSYKGPNCSAKEYCYEYNEFILNGYFNKNVEYHIYIYSDRYTNFRRYRRAQKFSCEVTYGLNTNAPYVDPD